MNNPQKIDTRDFVYNNITPYDGDESFLVGPTEKTIKLWNIVKGLMRAEFKKGGVLDIDTNTVSRINSHKAGYIDRELETIVGIQTDAPFKRAIKPLG
jgi:formate C-acetyltransferase